MLTKKIRIFKETIVDDIGSNSINMILGTLAT